MKRTHLFFAFLLVATALTLFVTTASAEVVVSGSCSKSNNNVTWSLDSDGTLAIQGEGELPDYISGSNQPWEPYKDQIREVSIGVGVTRIGFSAFRNCENLSKVIISKSVKTIDRYAFHNCPFLEKIIVSKDNTENSSDETGCLYNFDKSILIRYPAGCTNVSYAIPNTVLIIGEDAFSGCKDLRSITLPDSLTEIRAESFTNCNALTGVTIPYSVRTIAPNSFMQCDSLARINVSKKNPAYSSDEQGCLYNKDKTVLIQYPPNSIQESFIIPSSVKQVNEKAFSRCNYLVNISIPNGVREIPSNAFSGCTLLQSIIIPESIETIGDSAFYGCESLRDIYFTGSREKWENISVGNWNNLLSTAIIHYNSASDTSEGLSVGNTDQGAGDYTDASASEQSSPRSEGQTSATDYSAFKKKIPFFLIVILVLIFLLLTIIREIRFRKIKES